MIAVIVLSMTQSNISRAAEIHVHYDVGFGNNITIRGDASSFSWQLGEAAEYTFSNGEHVWRYDTPVADGGFEFKPLFSDQTWSTGNNYIVENGDSVVHIYPHFGSNLPTSGLITSLPNMHSEILNYDHSVSVYLPPSYTYDTHKNYPVVYTLDGQNLFGGGWNLDSAMDALSNSGQIREAIIIGIHNKGFGRMKEYTPTYWSVYNDGGDGDLFLDYIEQELMPEVNSRFRTLSGRDDTYIMGSSLGGLMSFYAGWTRSNVYGGVAGLSSSFFWDDDYIKGIVSSYSGPFITTTFYIDTGVYEINNGSGQSTVDLYNILNGKGYSPYSHLAQSPYDKHNEASWGDRVDIPLKILLAP